MYDSLDINGSVLKKNQVSHFAEGWFPEPESVNILCMQIIIATNRYLLMWNLLQRSLTYNLYQIVYRLKN